VKTCADFAVVLQKADSPWQISLKLRILVLEAGDGLRPCNGSEKESAEKPYK